MLSVTLTFEGSVLPTFSPAMFKDIWLSCSSPSWEKWYRKWSMKPLSGDNSLSRVGCGSADWNPSCFWWCRRHAPLCRMVGCSCRVNIYSGGILSAGSKICRWAQRFTASPITAVGFCEAECFPSCSGRDWQNKRKHRLLLSTGMVLHHLQLTQHWFGIRNRCVAAVSGHSLRGDVRPVQTEFHPCHPSWGILFVFLCERVRVPLMDDIRELEGGQPKTQLTFNCIRMNSWLSEERAAELWVECCRSSQGHGSCLEGPDSEGSPHHSRGFVVQ